MDVNPLSFLDEIVTGGQLVAAAGNSLLRRYGLGREPDAAAQVRWATITRSLIARGADKNRAGEEAARQVFPDFHTRAYASEGDTIETLLRLAEQK